MAALTQTVPESPEREVQVLDLRHFSGTELAPLLREEAAHWQRRHQWDYTRSTELLSEYLEARVLPGLVAQAANGRILGYTFCVYEAEKAVVGDVYAFGEGEHRPSPVSATLLAHLLETLQASPGVRRIEAQLLMFNAGILTETFRSFGFRAFPRLFLLADLEGPTLALQRGNAESAPALKPTSWRAEDYDEAAALIQRCYQGHGDSLINDQYQSISGARRFLHNIIRFPGCGMFDPESSLLLRDRGTGALGAMLLCSRVRADAAHITQLCVDPSLRGRGLGAMLLQSAAAHLRSRGIRSVSLTVTEANTQARALYASAGFQQLHRFEAMTWSK